MTAALAILLKNWRLIAIGLLLAALGAQTMRINNAQKHAAELRTQVAQASARAEKAERAEETRRQTVVNQEDTNAQARIASLETDLVVERAAAGKLRTAVANATRRARETAGASSVSKGEQGSDALDLLVLVYSRSDDAAGELGEYAERLRSAGLACERISDQLRTGQSLP